MLKKIARKEEGISALEYLLIAGLIALIIIAGAFALGTSMNTKFEELSTTVQDPSP